MAFLDFEQVEATDSVKTISAFTVPAETQFVELQADTAHVRYTMDGATNPTTSSGMLLLTTQPPRYFVVDEFRKIRFCRDGGSNAKLNVHYGTGRSVT